MSSEEQYTESSGENSLEKSREKMTMLLGMVAEVVNEYDELKLFGTFLNEDGRINDLAFQRGLENGPYTKKGNDGNSIKEDRALVREKELEWSDADHPNVQSNYGVQTTEDALNVWKKRMRETESEIAEEALFILLHKALGSEYIVLRTTQYDDYENGVDTLIVSKETGKTICAFDELLDMPKEEKDKLREREAKGGTKFEDRALKKLQRSKRLIQEEGGMKVKYGLFRDQETKELVRGEVEKIPAIYLPIKKNDLYNLREKMGTSLGEKSEVEMGILKDILPAIQEQKEILLNSDDQSSAAQDVEKLIDRLKEVTKSSDQMTKE